jgi:hypothetical protein
MGLIRLSDAINELREELKISQEKGKKHDLQFSIGAIEVEFEVIVEEELGSSAKVNWWIFGGGIDSKMKDASKHKIKLTLQVVDSSDRPFRVSDEQFERAE